MLENVYKFIVLFLIILSSFCLGEIFLKITRMKKSSSDSSILFSTTLGLGIKAYITLFLGLFYKIESNILWIFIIIFAFTGISLLVKNKINKILLIKLKKFYNIIINLDGFNLFLFGALIIFIVVNAIGSLAPPLIVDDIKYHFAIPKRYIDLGSITYIPDFAWSNLPFTMEMLWTLSIGLDSAELAQLLNWTIGIFVIFWIKKISNQLKLEVENIIVAIILFYTMTPVSVISQSGMVELGATLFFISGFSLLIDEFNSNNKLKSFKLCILSSIMFGLFASTKIPYLGISSAISLFYFIYQVINKDEDRKSIKKAIIFSCIAFFIPSIWLIKSYIYTSNPVYPLLADYFGSINQIDLLGGDVSKREFLHLKKFPFSIFDFFYNLIFFPRDSRGFISPIFITSIPLIFYQYKYLNKTYKLVSLLICLCFLLWIIMYPFIRIGIPILAVFSILVSSTIFHKKWKSIYFYRLFKLYVFTWILLSGLFLINYTHIKFSVAFGFQRPDEYVTRFSKIPRYNFKNYSAFQYMNENLPKNSKILLWSNDGFYLDREYYYTFGFLKSMVDPKKIYNPKYVIEELKSFGSTHVAMNDNYLRMPLKNILDSFKNLNVLYQDKHMVVKEL